MELMCSSLENSSDFGYANLLHDIQRLGCFGSIKFSRSIYSPEKWKYKVERTPQDIWKSVLNADRVQWITSKMAREEGKDKHEVLKEASRILLEMAFTEHLNLVRFFGFTLYHIMNKIYSGGVWYNTDTLEAIREAVREHPVILMPSHRCYMDFLVLSVLSIHAGLPLPAIASGMDFMTMKGINFLLRSSGAFFMRRSFGSDKLYWALFTEYVHSLIINSDRTIEFFIEGTRSRSGKSLVPKLGLLSVVVEPYLKAEIYDIMIVPVSISYDRILEESLYAYELLGVPKPKESTSGLFRATGILQQNYGSLHVHLGDPLSMRRECSYMDRSVHACNPRYMVRLTVKEQSCLTNLAYKIVHIQQKNMMIGLWSLITTVLSHSPGGIPFRVLIDEIQWLLDLSRRCNIRVKVEKCGIVGATKNVLLQYDHLAGIEMKIDHEIVTVKDGGKLNCSQTTSERNLTSLPAALRDKAAIYLMVASYRNQLVHKFVKAALVSIVIPERQHQIDICSKVVQEGFAFLREMFHKEFIFPPNDVKKDYEEGIQFLCNSGGFSKISTSLQIQSQGSKLVTFLSNLLRPFLQCYVMTCNYVSEFHDASEIKELCNSVQMWIAQEIGDDISLLETLSRDMISNAIHGIERLGALKFSKEDGKQIVHVRRRQAAALSERIKSLMKGKGSSTSCNEQSSKL